MPWATQLTSDYIKQVLKGVGSTEYGSNKDISLREVRAGLGDKQESARHQRGATAPVKPEGSRSGRTEARDG